ncbi:MAG TPA: AMIN domain-containing protein, partial [Thermodesulfovibrionales bacterium]|nr:AMIN domain-containing protein [Thermodesulfovibrionales bacterium]
MKRNTLHMILSMVLLAVLCVAGAPHAGYAKGESPGVTAITGINVQDEALEIKGDRPFVYTIYKSSDPYKVMVEIPNADIGAFRNVIKSESAGITEVMPSQIDVPKPVAKIEILLQTPSGVDSEYHNNSLVVRMKKDTAAQRPESMKLAALQGEMAGGSPGQQMQTAEEKGSMPAATEITGISMERGEGVVKVLIKGNGSLNPVAFTMKNRIVIDIPGVSAKGAMPSSVIPPVREVRAAKHDDAARVVIDLSEAKEFDVFSARDTIIVALKVPESMSAAAKADVQEPQPVRMDEEKMATREAVTTGAGQNNDRISLDFQDADVVHIFRLLADISGKNIVVSPDVRGKLTMKLINTPWEQALDLILKTTIPPLDKEVEGNVIRIGTAESMRKEREAQAAEIRKKIAEEPLETETFAVNYADVSVVEKAIRDARILSPRGSLSVDKRTSTLTVNDVRSVFRNVQDLLATLDKATPQVMIEARIVEVNTNDSRDLGIQWGVKISPVNNLSALAGYPLLGKGAVTGAPFMVDLPAGSVAAGSGTGFTFGILSPDKTFGLDLQLSALQTVGSTKIISNPRIVTTDNEKALIMQGTSEPFPKLTTEGTISTEYKDVVLSTEVTPHITPTGAIS